MSTDEEKPVLEPPDYLRSLVHYFKTEDSDVWQWFADHQTGEAETEAVRLELLKSTYRIEPDDQPELFSSATQAVTKLGLSAPVTLYQAQSGSSLNASLAYLPGEVHLILHGPVTKTLNELELLALLGHELTHFALLDGWDRDFAICQELLHALSVDAGADNASLSSARLASLHTEIFCDRGALAVCGDLNAAITALVKMETGATQVKAESYLKQAAEIFARGKIQSEGVTHPECFIRARALQLWQEEGATANKPIQDLLHGSMALGKLDLLAQQQVAELTRRLIDRLLTPDWLQTDAVLGHARLYFDTYTPPDAGLKDGTLVADIATDDDQLCDYYCYVLLDFVTADSSLDEFPLAAAMLLARELKLEDRFAGIALKEMRLRKKQLEAVQQQATELVKKASQETSKT